MGGETPDKTNKVDDDKKDGKPEKPVMKTVSVGKMYSVLGGGERCLFYFAYFLAFLNGMVMPG